MPPIKPLSFRRDEVSKALRKMSSEDLVVTRLEYGETAEGFRWQLYKGALPFWVDLVRFSGRFDMLVVFSIMFAIPENISAKREAELYKYLLEINDFSQSWESKLFLKEKAIILCASRIGDEIGSESAGTLVDRFTQSADIVSAKISENFPDIVRVIVQETESDIDLEDIERKDG